MMLSFFKDKKVFITGHTGFKGSWLCEALLFAGADVTGYALPASEFPSLFNMTGLDKRIRSLYGDIRDYESLCAALADARPEIVFHLAAQPLVRQSYKEPLETYSVNVMGTVHLLEAVRNTSSVRSVINVTTDKVYENKEWCWGYRENENLCGYDPYSNSKSCSELVTYSYKKSFFDSDTSPAVSTARSGNVIGGGDFAADRIIPDCFRAAERKLPIALRNPYSTRPYQHVLECLSGYLLLARKQYEDKRFADSYNFGPDDKSCVTTGTLAGLFCDKWGSLSWHNTAEQNSSQPHEANFLKLNCTKAKTVLGWNPHWDIEKAVEATVEWYKCFLNRQDVQLCMKNQIQDYFKDI